MRIRRLSVFCQFVAADSFKNVKIRNSGESHGQRDVYIINPDGENPDSSASIIIPAFAIRGSRATPFSLEQVPAPRLFEVVEEFKVRG